MMNSSNRRAALVDRVGRDSRTEQSARARCDGYTLLMRSGSAGSSQHLATEMSRRATTGVDIRLSGAAVE